MNVDNADTLAFRFGIAFHQSIEHQGEVNNI